MTKEGVRAGTHEVEFVEVAFEVLEEDVESLLDGDAVGEGDEVVDIVARVVSELNL